ncbi:nitrate ABC transporter substrate-binding protein [Mycobacterium sp. 852013-50091_SCH5140682]|uniref:ABC transporter substrate-binding protein n=1 Tax=Mycobacterium sp. 852013-50091_SCH5140682 TaxID=1834109 RepID=UPI0007EA8278|nr:ABC transporter substrate-binding protein [Mycobacterium sp. 852013-50091_SCH5140682]OBC01636.1 nitrate ABC transporter substrate-binding protein [Mycobacterium sp. 852013-50091_SCH5140682]
MITRAPRLAAALSAVVFAAGLLSGCGNGRSENSMSLMVDVGYLPKHAPFFAAVHRGFFGAEGLDVTVMPGSGSGNTVTAVETGRVDAGWADFGVTVLNQGRGAKVKQVNLLQAKSAYAVVSMAGKGINTWADLKGKTVATEGAGAMTSMWPYALKRLGLQQRDVNVVHAASSAKLPGLLSGQWDATLALSVSDAPAIDALGRDPVVLRWRDLGIDLYGNGIIFSDDSLKNRPDRVRRFNNALQRAFLWSCQNPELAAEDFHREVAGYETKTVVKALDEQCSLNWPDDNPDSRFGTMTDAGVQKVIDICHDFLGLDKEITVSPAQVYSDDFIAPLSRTQKIAAP